MLYESILWTPSFLITYNALIIIPNLYWIKYLSTTVEYNEVVKNNFISFLHWISELFNKIQMSNLVQYEIP